MTDLGESVPDVDWATQCEAYDDATHGPVLYWARAVYPFTAERPEELSCWRDAIIGVLEERTDGWWRCELEGRTGLLAYNYIERVDDGSAPAAGGGDGGATSAGGGSGRGSAISAASRSPSAALTASSDASPFDSAISLSGAELGDSAGSSTPSAPALGAAGKQRKKRSDEIFAMRERVERATAEAIEAEQQLETLERERVQLRLQEAALSGESLLYDVIKLQRVLQESDESDTSVRAVTQALVAALQSLPKEHKLSGVKELNALLADFPKAHAGFGEARAAALRAVASLRQQLQSSVSLAQ